MNLHTKKAYQILFFTIEYNKSKIKTTMDEEEEIDCNQERRGN
jgi:hypothetical protein